MHRLINLDHPFFARPVRRYLTVAVCLMWGLIELVLGNHGWAILFLAVAAVAQWQFARIDWSKYDGGH